MEIRRATESDYPTVAALSAEVGELHHEALPHIITPDPISENAFHEVLADSECTTLLAIDEGQAVGYIIYRIVEQPASDFFYAQRSLYIQECGVNQAHQRKGYGEALMNQAVEAAKKQGISRITLNVWAFNQGAVAFYERLGFKALTIKMAREL